MDKIQKQRRAMTNMDTSAPGRTNKDALTVRDVAMLLKAPEDAAGGESFRGTAASKTSKCSGCCGGSSRGTSFAATATKLYEYWLMTDAQNTGAAPVSWCTTHHCVL